MALDTFIPSPLAPDSVKNTEKYGLQVSRSIYSRFSQANSFIVDRNAKWIDNVNFAQGQQPMGPYLDLVDINGKSSYLDLIYRAVPIAKKYSRVVIGRFMDLEEKPKVSSLSKDIIERKNQKADEAEFRMNNKEFIMGMQEQTGVQLEDPNAFYPESEEHLEWWKEMNDKEREEILMEKALDFYFKDNDYKVQKERVLYDLWIKALGVKFTYVDSTGRIKTDVLRPEDCVYGPSNRNDLKDIGYAGHLIQMKITEARVMFPKVPEKIWYEAACTYRGVYGNVTNLGLWNIDWNYQYIRPYDDFVINMMHVWYKCVKEINYVSGSDSRGRRVLDFVKTPGTISNPNKKSGMTPVFTAYEGYWIMGTNTMAEWGEAKNMIRYNTKLEDVICPYSFYMYDNFGGMNPSSIIDNIKGDLEGMDLVRLQIQRVVATAKMDGWAVDLDALDGVNVGTGKLEKFQVLEMARQTGEYYYRSLTEAGELKPNGGDPFRLIQNSYGDKLQELMALWNWHIKNIEDFTGVNPQAAGQDPNPKLAVGVMQTQIATANTAISFLYRGYLNLVEQEARKAGQLIWDSIKYSKDNEGYVGILGKENVDFIRERKEITDSNYDLSIELAMTQEDKLFLEQQIQTGLAAGTLQLEDAVAARAMPTMKLAYRYLVMAQKRNRTQANEDAAMRSEENAKVAASAARAKGQEDIALQQLKGKDDKELAQIQAKSKSDLAHQQFVYNAMLEGIKAGKIQPNEFKSEFAKIQEDNALNEELEMMALQQQMQGAQPQQGMPQEEISEEQMSVPGAEMQEEQMEYQS